MDAFANLSLTATERVDKHLYVGVCSLTTSEKRCMAPAKLLLSFSIPLAIQNKFSCSRWSRHMSTMYSAIQRSASPAGHHRAEHMPFSMSMPCMRMAAAAARAAASITIRETGVFTSVSLFVLVLLVLSLLPVSLVVLLSLSLLLTGLTGLIGLEGLVGHVKKIATSATRGE